jgi:hypothetical protein
MIFDFFKKPQDQEVIPTILPQTVVKPKRKEVSFPDPAKLSTVERKMLAAILHFCISDDTRFFKKSDLKAYFPEKTEERWIGMSASLVQLGKKNYIRLDETAKKWMLTI